jgi:general secretion pathway protein K
MPIKRTIGRALRDRIFLPANRRSPTTVRSSDERGVALILTLLILALLITLIFDFDAAARRELREAAAFRDDVRAFALSRAAVHAVRALSYQDSRLKLQTGQSHDGLHDLWARPIVDLPLGDGLLTARLADERGKLNLNDLGDAADPLAQKAKTDRLKRLFELLKLDPRLVDGIVDWVDADEDPQPDGAESAYYQSLNPPYRAANAPLKTVKELALIKGMTDAVVRRVQPYVTVYGGEGWVNINTADPLVIQALDPDITLAMAGELVQLRPFRTVQEADQVSAFEPIAKSKLRPLNAYRVQTDYLSARMTVSIGEVTKIATAVFQRNPASGQTQLRYFRVE